MSKTKITVLLWIGVLLAPAVLCAGDAPFVALRPVYTLQTAVVNQGLVGVWTNLFTFLIEPNGDAGCQVRGPADGQEYARFHLAQFGGETIAGLVLGEVKFLPPQAPAHCFAQVHVARNTLRLGWLGSESLAQGIERTGWPRHQCLRVKGQDEDLRLLTASSADLQQFVSECLRRPEDFGESDDFEGAGPKTTAAELAAPKGK